MNALTVEQARVMPESFKAFRRVDGEDIYEGVTWCDSDVDWLDCDCIPFEIEEVVMVVVPVGRRWIGTHLFAPCDDSPDECDRCSGPRESYPHAETP